MIDSGYFYFNSIYILTVLIIQFLIGYVAICFIASTIFSIKKYILYKYKVSKNLDSVSGKLFEMSFVSLPFWFLLENLLFMLCTICFEIN